MATPQPILPITELAARNNAGWYHLMFDAHGIPHSRSATLLGALSQPPRFHSWGVTLHPGQESFAEVLDLQRAADGPFGIKDSFNCLDLHPHGMTTLFTAQWIHRRASSVEMAAEYRRLETDAELLAWEAAWAEGDADAKHYPRQFPPSLLGRVEVAFISCLQNRQMVGGCILNQTDTVVGISNLFSTGVPFAALFAKCIAAASHFFPGRDIVGYERGDLLAASIEAGFLPVGTLRIWTSK
jgi:hypothetical protein